MYCNVVHGIYVVKNIVHGNSIVTDGDQQMTHFKSFLLPDSNKVIY
jgi:hypothetical protein